MKFLVLYVIVIILLYMCCNYKEFFKRKKNKLKKVKKMAKDIKKFVKKIMKLKKDILKYEKIIDLTGKPPKPDYEKLHKIINDDKYIKFKSNLREIKKFPMWDIIFGLSIFTVMPPPINSVASSTLLLLRVPGALYDNVHKYLGELDVIEFKYTKNFYII